MKNPNLPEEMLIEIFSRLPWKSVGRCRCLSKSWRKTLSTSQFAKLHHSRGSRSHLIISKTGIHTFNFDGAGKVGPRKLNFPAEFHRVAGSCDGLVLLCRRDELLVVNFLTLEQVSIKQKPSLADVRLGYANDSGSYGFGYDSCSDDYKIVKLSLGPTNRDPLEVPRIVDVYSLKKGAWKTTTSTTNPFPLSHSNYYGVFVNGSIFWVHMHVQQSRYMLVAFDVASESFRRIPTPIDVPAPNKTRHFRIFENGGCLLMVCNGDIWIMKENGQENSWSKFPKSISFEGYRVRPLFLVGGNEVVLARERRVNGSLLARERSLIVWNLIDGTTKDLIVDGALDKEELICDGVGKRIDGVTYVESLVSPIQNQANEVLPVIDVV